MALRFLVALLSLVFGSPLTVLAQVVWRRPRATPSGVEVICSSSTVSAWESRCRHVSKGERRSRTLRVFHWATKSTPRACVAATVVIEASQIEAKPNDLAMFEA